MKLNNNQRTYAKIGGSVLAVLLVCGIFIHGHYMEDVTAEQASEGSNKAHIARAAYGDKKDRVKHELFNNATQSKDTTIRTIAVNGSDNTAIHPPFLKFFKIYYNWNSNAEYSARPKKLKDIATPKILHDKTYFGSGRDKTGGKFIDKSQLNSEFNNLNTYVINHKGDNIEVLADVQYNSWHSNTDNQSTSEKWFKMNYNLKQKKITSMNTLYTDSNVKNSND